MISKKSLAASVILSATVCGALLTSPVEGKTWTIDERQVQLMQDINAGQKRKELTLKEAKSLRKALANVARDKKQLKAKTQNGKLTAENNSQLEADLNKVSEDLKKYQLEKRVDTTHK